MYGIRRYKAGSWLATHLDRIDTHVISVIINVAQAGVKAGGWPLVIADHQGEAHRVSLRTGETVDKVEFNTVVTGSGTRLPFGLCVWSTGNAPLDVVKSLGLELSRDGRILVDDKLRVRGQDSVRGPGPRHGPEPGSRTRTQARV